MEWFMGWRERQIWRTEGDEEQAILNDYLATWGQGDIQAWPMSKGQVLVLGFGVAEEVCVIVCGFYLQWGWCRDLWSGQHTILDSLLSNLGPWWHPDPGICHGSVDHVWVHGPVGGGFYIDVPGPCCLHRPLGCPGSGQWAVTKLVSKGFVATEGRLNWVTCQLGPWFCLYQGCGWRTCLGLWSCHRQGLCWCL